MRNVSFFVRDNSSSERESLNKFSRRRYSCCILTSDPAKHAIPKTAEVAYSVGVGELGWQYGTGLIPRYSHKLMYRKRVTCELHDSYFRSMMIKTCHSKDGGSCIFRWPFMGRDWVGVELLYNSVHRKFNQLEIRWVGEQKSWRNDAVEKTAPGRRGPRDPRLSSWGSDELEIRCGREN